MIRTNETSANTLFQKLHLDALRAVVREVLGDRAPARWAGVAQLELMVHKMPHDLTHPQTVAVHALCCYEALYYASQLGDLDTETQEVFDSRVAHASTATTLNLLATLVTDSQGVICRTLASSLLIDAPANQIAAPNRATATHREAPVTTTALDWRTRVRDAATAYALERLAKRLRTTKQSAALEMVVWCRNNEVKTDMGKPVQANYLKRHILRTWTPPT